jgi:hypothetical protein
MTGRRAIDFLKAEWDRGTAFADTATMRDTVVRELGLKPTRVTMQKMREWARQAQLEAADARLVVTSPTKRNGGLRDPNASPTVRYQSRLQHQRSYTTALKNDYRLALADAAQVDAKPAEIERKTILQVMVTLAQQLVESTAQDATVEPVATAVAVKR